MAAVSEPQREREREREKRVLPPAPPISERGGHPPPHYYQPRGGGGGPPPPPRPRFEPVDREKTCPLLLRVFTRILVKENTRFEIEISLLRDWFDCFQVLDLGTMLLVDTAECASIQVAFIDYALICSMLFTPQVGTHHTAEDFAIRGKEPKEEVQIYTWKDATLRELTELVKEVDPAARRRDAKLSFAFVYPDKHGRYVLRQVGVTHSSGRRIDDGRALADLNFQIGDYLDVAII
ncbi:hypothetical protein IFM89_031676 [Coptis chinensis]|uniref:Histone deacetylase complex subunit SAP18 n=1 Tax=Coptis chinensis TaxID=261450 RepID=A0A835LX92_9MAGN|nr:hypothetical protein IFM89_031676 [Coptis chinensis]